MSRREGRKSGQRDEDEENEGGTVGGGKDVGVGGGGGAAAAAAAKEKVEEVEVEITALMWQKEREASRLRNMEVRKLEELRNDDEVGGREGREKLTGSMEESRAIPRGEGGGVRRDPPNGAGEGADVEQQVRTRCW